MAITNILTVTASCFRRRSCHLDRVPRALELAPGRGALDQDQPRSRTARTVLGRALGSVHSTSIGEIGRGKKEQKAGKRPRILSVT